MESIFRLSPEGVLKQEKFRFFSLFFFRKFINIIKSNKPNVQYISFVNIYNSVRYNKGKEGMESKFWTRLLGGSDKPTHPIRKTP
jgi:hypothetical protein